jgi:hypothetical protein
MSGGHSHAGGSGGSHSHGGGSGADPVGGFIVAVLIAGAFLLSITSANWIGRALYNSRASHPHLGKVSGDWGALFVTLGFAVILGGLGILLLVTGVLMSNGWLGGFGVILVAGALLLGLVVAPHFRNKVATYAAAPMAQQPLGSLGQSGPSPGATAAVSNPPVSHALTNTTHPLPPPTRISQQITFISPIHAAQSQAVNISGVGFGSQMPFVGDLPCIQIVDMTKGWAAGHIDPLNGPSGSGAACSAVQGPVGDYVTVKVLSWTDSTIQIGGFSGSYDSSGWFLSPGDRVSVEVWNAQSGAGPVAWTVAVIT